MYDYTAPGNEMTPPDPDPKETGWSIDRLNKLEEAVKQLEQAVFPLRRVVDPMEDAYWQEQAERARWDARKSAQHHIGFLTDLGKLLELEVDQGAYPGEAMVIEAVKKLKQGS